MMTFKERQRLMELKHVLDKAKELARDYEHGRTNYSADEVEVQLTDARNSFNEYLDQITEKQMSFDKDEYSLMRNEHPSQNPHEVNTTFKLKASVQTYELSVPDLQKLISKELVVPEARITITSRQRDTSGPMDRTPNYVFDGLTITVKNT